MGPSGLEQKDLAGRVERLEKTLGSLVTWLQRELGDHGVAQLLDMLEGKRSK